MSKKGTQKKLDVKVEEVKVVNESVEIIVFKPNKPLTVDEFNMLSDMVKLENKKSGVKIILMPYSCEVVEDVK